MSDCHLYLFMVGHPARKSQWGVTNPKILYQISHQMKVTEGPYLLRL